MSNYTVIRSNDHLEHYGVKGMKWGVRKQYEYNRTYTTKNGSRQNINRNKKGLINRYNTSYYAKLSNKTSKKAYINEHKSKTAKTKLGKHIRTVRGRNLRSDADMYKKWAEEGTKVLDRLDDVFDQSVTRLSGRQTTWGKEYIFNTLTSGLYGTVEDIKYLRNKG